MNGETQWHPPGVRWAPAEHYDDAMALRDTDLGLATFHLLAGLLLVQMGKAGQ